MELVILVAVVGVLVISGIAKIPDREGLEDAMEGFGVPSSLIPIGAVLLPWIELILAAGLLFFPTQAWSALLVMLMFLIFTLMVARVVMANQVMDCHCFGQLDAGPVGWRTVARNLVLTIAAGIIAWWSFVQGSISIWEEFTWLRLGVGLVSILCLAMAWVIQRQRETISELVDRLEQTRALIPAGRMPKPAIEHAYQRLVEGLEIVESSGVSVPVERLHDVRKPALLLFVSSSCRACVRLLPSIAQWQQAFGEMMPISVIGEGDTQALTEQAREHGVERLYFRMDAGLVEVLGLRGQPAAVLIDHDGFVRRNPVTGRDNIGGLVAALKTEAGLS